MVDWIIADSGGTKTDWCRVSGGEVVERLETVSYHPAYFSAARQQEMKLFWMQRPEWLELPLYFFGSGCFREEGKNKTTTTLHNLGFHQAKVRSDVHAAVLATLGNQPGWVAILGTGSVLVEWSGSEVISLFGGKGHLSGDEGSGFYFGRLLMEKYRENTLDLSARKLVDDYLAVHSFCPSEEEEKAAYSALAINPGGRAEFDSLHAENITTFFKEYTGNIPNGTTLHFVGSYAAAHKAILLKILPQFSLIPGQIIGRPISRLLEQSVYFID